MSCQICDKKQRREIVRSCCGSVLCDKCMTGPGHGCYEKPPELAPKILDTRLNEANSILSPVSQQINASLDNVCNAAIDFVNRSKTLPTLQLKIDLLQTGLNLCDRIPEARNIIMAEYNKLTMPIPLSLPSV